MKLCVDCIHVGVCYRQGVVDLNYADKCGDYEVIRKGHWVHKGQGIYCSECGKESGYNPFGASRFSDFCQSCGADMRGDIDGNMDN